MPEEPAPPHPAPAPVPAPKARPAWRARAARWAPSAAAALALGLAGFFPVGNPDTFGHLAAGRLIAALHAVPRTDPFSFFRATPQPWFNYEWLSGLALWAAYSLGGVNALLGLKLALVAVLGALLVRKARDGAAREGGGLDGVDEREAHERGAAWLCVALVLLALPTSRVRLSERPHLFGLVLAALYLVALPRVAAGALRRPALAYAGLALAHAAWVNLHGSHLFGLLLTALHGAAYLTARDARAARSLALVLGLQCVATTVTPYGPRIVVDAIEHLSRNEYRLIVTEWAPLSRATGWPSLVTWGGAAGLLALAARGLWRRGPSGRAGLFTGAVLAVMAARSQRFLVDFALFSSAIVAAPLWGSLAPRLAPRARALAPYALAAAALAASVPLTAREATEPFGAGLSRTGLPLGCGRWINERAPRARLLAGVADAWYVEFAAPQARVLVDGRVPFFGAEFCARVVTDMQSAGGLAALGRAYGLDALVTRHTDEAGGRATRAALALPEWVLVYIEDEHALFLRAATPERAAALEALRLRALPVGYDAAALLDPARDPALVREELRRIATPGAGVGYRSWAAAVLDLRALARDGASAGFLHGETPERRALAARAAGRLRAVEREVELPPPSLAVYRSLAEASACELDAARASLVLARERGGDSRETLFAGLELALREGRLDEVRAFVEAARAQGGDAARDPWVAALEASLRAPPRCP